MRTKVIYAVTVPESLSFLDGQLRYLTERGYEVKALCSAGDRSDGDSDKAARSFSESEGVPVLTVKMEREIAPLQDLKAIAGCVRLLRRERPDIVHASTPKASLVVTAAAAIAGVPVRIYNFRGLRMETATGLKRRILLTAEKITAAAATHCLAVSPSLKKRIGEFGIAPDDKVRVLGDGSGDGFRISRFRRTPQVEDKIRQIRRTYGLTENHAVLGFVGRLTKDKGIDTLISVFRELNRRHPQLRLLLIGEPEEADAPDRETLEEIRRNPNIIEAGYQADPVPFFHLMDLFLFLTKREGFGNVSVEAALCGVPVIASDVTGARDTLLDGRTGLLANPDDREGLLEKIDSLITSPERRKAFGDEGRRWAAATFDNERLWQEIDSYYRRCLDTKTRPAMQVSRAK